MEVKDLNVVLDGEKIIEDLSFSVRRGDVLTVLGPNGAGKTVLLKTLLGLLPYQGRIWWKAGVKAGYVPQRLPFIKDFPMSVAEFFELKGVSLQETRDILSSVGFGGEVLNRKIGQVSSGQFQRILIAWALAKKSEVLLFDEPTAGVDIGGEETIYSLLNKLKIENKLTILLVTHDLSVVSKFSNFVICLNRSSVCQGAPKQVLSTGALQKLYGDEVKFYGHQKV